MEHNIIENHKSVMNTPTGEGTEQDRWLDGFSLPHSQLSGHFQLGPIIGSGSFGRVHLLHSHEGQTLACKVVLKERAGQNGTVSAHNAYKQRLHMVRRV